MYIVFAQGSLQQPVYKASYVSVMWTMFSSWSCQMNSAIFSCFAATEDSFLLSSKYCVKLCFIACVLPVLSFVCYTGFNGTDPRIKKCTSELVKRF